MKNSPTVALAFSAALLISASFTLAIAQTPMDHSAHNKLSGTAAQTSPAAAKDMADGEIRKIDADNQKITLKHGYIKNIDMPGMTMVFTTQTKAMLDGLTTGDKVKFAVEMVGGKFTITDIKKDAP